MKSTLAPSNTVVEKKVTTRDPKGSKFISIVEAAYNKANLTNVEAQRINNTPGLSDLVQEFIEGHRCNNEYSEEEIKSDIGYFSGYKRPKSVAHQIKILHNLFPGQWGYFRFDENALNCELAEGVFAIPDWKKHPEIFGSTYSSAVQKILDTLKETRKGCFLNYREGEIDEEHFHQSAKSAKFWAKLSETQGNLDILLVPAQFGIRHRGRSVRRARAIIDDTPGEVGLGAFAVGSMLLTHPERLQHRNDLWIDCAEDKFSPGANGSFSRAPHFFCLVRNELTFGTGDIKDVDDHYGAASGFFPQ